MPKTVVKRVPVALVGAVERLIREYQDRAQAAAAQAERKAAEEALRVILGEE